MVRAFAEREVEPQALEFDKNEAFNHPLFLKLGELGLLGITVDPAYGGSGMDATAATIVHEELSAVDPGFTLAYWAFDAVCEQLGGEWIQVTCQRFLPRPVRANSSAGWAWASRVPVRMYWNANDCGSGWR